MKSPKRLVTSGMPLLALPSQFNRSLKLPSSQAFDISICHACMFKCVASKRRIPHRQLPSGNQTSKDRNHLNHKPYAVHPHSQASNPEPCAGQPQPLSHGRQPTSPYHRPETQTPPSFLAPVQQPASTHKQARSGPWLDVWGLGTCLGVPIPCDGLRSGVHPPKP